MYPATKLLFVLTQSKARNLIAIHRQEPQRRIMPLAFDRPVFPLLKGGGNMAPVIKESFFIGLKDCPLHTRHHCLYRNAIGPLRHWWSFTHLNAHAPEVSGHLKTV